jgi:hypothetical protein
MRRLGHRSALLTVSFHMRSSQVTIFETFVRDTLLGVRRFGMPHPRMPAQNVEVRIVPGEGGDMYSLSRVAPNLWSVGMTLEVMP